MAQGQHGQRAGRDGANRRAAEERQIAGAINSLHRDYKATQDKRAKNESDQHKWQRRVAITTIVYTFVTTCIFGGGIFAIYQTSNAIDAANRSANISEDSERRQLRAYVTIKMAAIDIFAVGQAVTIKGWMRNYGATPANHVGSRYAINIIPDPKSSFVQLVDYRILPKIGLGTTYPNEDETFVTSLSENAERLTDDQFRNINNGRYVVAYYGTVYYSDIFRKGWATDYCFFFTSDNIAKHAFTKCANHHGADEESERDMPPTR